MNGTYAFLMFIMAIAIFVLAFGWAFCKVGKDLYKDLYKIKTEYADDLYKINRELIDLSPKHRKEIRLLDAQFGIEVLKHIKDCYPRLPGSSLNVVLDKYIDGYKREVERNQVGESEVPHG